MGTIVLVNGQWTPLHKSQHSKQSQSKVVKSHLPVASSNRHPVGLSFGAVALLAAKSDTVIQHWEDA
ncbi:MAG TPA: hypothetical protein VKE71_14740 [Candidatus Angelobacter sp.]|nr:hypothetical protein [Candidatus Angelobacter sp.]